MSAQDPVVKDKSRQADANSSEPGSVTRAERTERIGQALLNAISRTEKDIKGMLEEPGEERTEPLSSPVLHKLAKHVALHRALGVLSRYVAVKYNQEITSLRDNWEREGREIGEKYAERRQTELESVPEPGTAAYTEYKKKFDALGKEYRKELADLDLRAVLALDTIESLYSEAAGSQDNMIHYLANQVLPELEVLLLRNEETFSAKPRDGGQAGKEAYHKDKDEYIKIKEKLERDIADITMDIQQLRLLKEVRALSQRLEYVLGYDYLPDMLEEEAFPLMGMLDRGGQRDRADVLSALEMVVDKYSDIASSPSKAYRYLVELTMPQPLTEQYEYRIPPTSMTMQGFPRTQFAVEPMIKVKPKQTTTQQEPQYRDLGATMGATRSIGIRTQPKDDEEIKGLAGDGQEVQTRGFGDDEGQPAKGADESAHMYGGVPGELERKGARKGVEEEPEEPVAMGVEAGEYGVGGPAMGQAMGMGGPAAPVEATQERLSEPKVPEAAEPPQTKEAKIAHDLEVADSHKDAAAPIACMCKEGVRCRFPVNGFEAISDPRGMRIVRLVHNDGSQVAFVGDGETRVVNASGESAIFQFDGTIDELIQVADSDGNVIQFSDKRMVRLMDSDGSMMILDSGASHRGALITPEGNYVFKKDKIQVFLKKFEALFNGIQEDSLVARENAFGFRSILLEAKNALPNAEKQLAVLSHHGDKHERKPRKDEECIIDLSTRLRDAGVLKFDGPPSADGFDATFGINKEADKNEFNVKVLSKDTLEMIRKAATKNHPAHVFLNPENTLVVQVPEMFFENEVGMEHEATYSRVFTMKFGDSYCTVLALHERMVDAIRANYFDEVGICIYGSVIIELKKEHNFVDLKLGRWGSEKSDVCSCIKERYGEDFLEAMRKRDYGALGRREVFDRLVHDVTHSLTRAKTRMNLHAELSEMGVTSDDQTLFSSYIVMRFNGKQPDEVKDEIFKMYLEAYEMDLPVSLKELNVIVSDLRREFLLRPTKESYETYQKADVFRDIVRNKRGDSERDGTRNKIMDDFTARITAFSSSASDMARHVTRLKDDADGYTDECRTAFKKIIRMQLLTAQARVVDEALAISMQRTRYNTRGVPTVFTISRHLQGIASSKTGVGHEALFNELRGEVTPWDMVRRANQLKYIARGYVDYGFVRTTAKVSRDDELKARIQNVFSIIDSATSLGKRMGGAA